MAAEDLVEIVKGWTGPLDFQLQADPDLESLVGATVAFIVRDQVGVLLTLAGSVAVVDSGLKTVRYNPAAADFNIDLGPYAYRWRVTDVSGKVVYFPSGQAGTIRVRV